MPEIGPEHPVTYRQELVAPIFARIWARESCAVVGAASMGKSRLLKFLLRPDVQAHYLPPAASPAPLLVCADGNRLAETSTWGLFELMLTALVETVPAHLRPSLLPLRHDTIVAHSSLVAQRNLELALQITCHEGGLQLCFVLDECDLLCQSLPDQVFANLRALRDQHKYQLSYLLFLRDDPANLRPPAAWEGFYELVARSILGLHPYTAADARRVLAQLAARRQHEGAPLDEVATTAMLHLSGGHPGLLVALFDAYLKAPPPDTGWQSWAEALTGVVAELHRLWGGLRPPEQAALHHLAHDRTCDFRARASLALKGLIGVSDTVAQPPVFFSPLLHNYALQRAPVERQGIFVDRQSGSVWVNGAACESLTAKEFDLLAFLDSHAGEICSISQIIEGVYREGERFGITDNTVAALVTRVRKKIEPQPQLPRFLLNVKGRGYKFTPHTEPPSGA